MSRHAYCTKPTALIDKAADRHPSFFNSPRGPCFSKPVKLFKNRKTTGAGEKQGKNKDSSSFSEASICGFQ